MPVKTKKRYLAVSGDGSYAILAGTKTALWKLFNEYARHDYQLYLECKAELGEKPELRLRDFRFRNGIEEVTPEEIAMYERQGMIIHDLD